MRQLIIYLVVLRSLHNSKIYLQQYFSSPTANIYDISFAAAASIKAAANDEVYMGTSSNYTQSKNSLQEVFSENTEFMFLNNWNSNVRHSV